MTKRQAWRLHNGDEVQSKDDDAILTLVAPPYELGGKVFVDVIDKCNGLYMLMLPHTDIK